MVYTARDGELVRVGQSMPSSSIDNCARLSDTAPSSACGQYRNNRDGTFTDVTEKSGLGQSVWSTGITVADYDNDGFDDLFITCWGQNLLFHNNGNGTFTDVTAKAGLTHPGNRYATGCTWLD
jgi:hypothetical protein